MDPVFDVVLGDLWVLLLEVPHAVGLGGEAHVALLAEEGLEATAAVGAQVVLERAEELEVDAAVLADRVRGVERVDKRGRLQHVLVVADRRLDVLLHHLAMLLSEYINRLFDVSLHHITFPSESN